MTAWRRITAVVVPVAAGVVGLAIALVVVAVSGYDPLAVTGDFAAGAWGTPASAGLTIETTVVLLLVALAWITAFRGGRINVGLQGQVIVGAIVALVVVLHLPLGGGGFRLFAAVVAACLGGAAFAGIAAALLFLRGASELITTLFLNFVAVELLDWALTGPLGDPNAAEPQSLPVPPGARWPALGFLQQSVTADVILAGAVLIAVSFVMKRTTLGLRLRLVGASPSVAKAMGTSPARVGAAVLVISGAIGGLAGSSLLLAGPLPALTGGFYGSFGFDGIAVGLLARNRPWGALPAAAFIATVQSGASLAAARTGLPSGLSLVIEGTIIVAVAGSDMVVTRMLSARARGASDSASEQPQGDMGRSDDPLGARQLVDGAR